MSQLKNLLILVQKESEYMHIILYRRLSITVSINYIFCILLDSKQINYSKIGELWLFMMYKLNIKWP